ncbi:MAG: hypothetical protein ACI9YO_002857, partial [Gammaproteobacteria bacterium]
LIKLVASSILLTKPKVGMSYSLLAFLEDPRSYSCPLKRLLWALSRRLDSDYKGQDTAHSRHLHIHKSPQTRCFDFNQD